MLSKNILNDLLWINNKQDLSSAPLLIQELLWLDTTSLGLVSIIGYGNFSVHSKILNKSFDLKMITLYHPKYKKCYSHCIEFDMVLYSKHSILNSVEKLVVSVVEYLAESIKNDELLSLICSIQERYCVNEMATIYNYIINNNLENHFKVIVNSDYSQDRIKNLLNKIDDITLEFYQYNALQIKNKSNQ